MPRDPKGVGNKGYCPSRCHGGSGPSVTMRKADHKLKKRFFFHPSFSQVPVLGAAWHTRGGSGHPSPVCLLPSISRIQLPWGGAAARPRKIHKAWGHQCLATHGSGTQPLSCHRKLDACEIICRRKEPDSEIHRYAHQFKRPRSDVPSLRPRSPLETPARGGHWPGRSPKRLLKKSQDP